MENEVDLLICVGGDGSILYTLRNFQKQMPPPLIAIEKGTLGFMAMYQEQTLERDFQHLFDKLENQHRPINVEQKMRLTVRIVQVDEGGREITDTPPIEYQALNEVVVDRGDSTFVKLDIYANGISLTQFQGDGLIFSTPTGSTAYNLSAGGPIVYNEVDGITITPLAPFTLSFRPIILPNCTKFRIRLSKDSRGNASVNADGQMKIPITRSHEIQIFESAFPVQMIRERTDDFFSEWTCKLKKLLNWNNTGFDKN